MTVLGQRQGGRGVLVAGGLGATLAIHVGLIAVTLVMRAREREAEAARGPILGTVVEVQAVKFGKPRDLTFLPHKEAPPPPKDRPKLALTEDEHALPKPPKPDDDEQRTADDPLKRTRANLFKNLADPDATGTAEDVGDPNGLRGGTALVGKGPIYLQHLVAAIQNAWVVPTTIKDSELAKLTAMACIKIAADGKITEYKVMKPSGDDRFDATLINAIASIQQFEPPTPDVKDIVTGDGVCLNFKKDRP